MENAEALLEKLQNVIHVQGTILAVDLSAYMAT